MHYLRIIELISKLMEVPQDRNIGDLWTETYMEFLEQAINYEVTSRGESLKPLAKSCYGRLISVLEGV